MTVRFSARPPLSLKLRPSMRPPDRQGKSARERLTLIRIA
jgi:hypothetical protein